MWVTLRRDEVKEKVGNDRSFLDGFDRFVKRMGQKVDVHFWWDELSLVLGRTDPELGRWFQWLTESEMLPTWSLRNSNFRGLNLPGSYLRSLDLSLSDLSEVNLSLSDLCEVKMRFCKAPHANLIHANVRGASLPSIDLPGAVLRSAWFDLADLSCANLRGANVTTARFVGTNLQGANLEGVVGLHTALFDDSSELTFAYYPEGQIPPGWVRDDKGLLRRA